MSLRDAICAAARGGIYIISLPRFIEAISQPNAREVISHLPDKANISPKRIPYGICDMHLTVRYMSLRDAICAAARGGIYIISLPRFIEAISQPNAREVISHLPDKANISPKRIPCGICDMHLTVRYMSLRDAICAAARGGIYIISLPRFIEAISQPNAREVISHLPDKANISPKRIPYGICDMPVGT